MAANKRSPFEIAQHRHQIAHLYLQRKTQHAIAAQMGISRDMVAYDLAAIQARWREETTIDLDTRKGEELARIDALEREYWRAWEASHDLWEEPAAPESYDGELALKRAQRAVRKDAGRRTGFAGYLEGVAWCIDQRCKLLGLYPSTKGEQSTHTVIVLESGKPAEVQASALSPLAALGMPDIIEVDAADGHG